MDSLKAESQILPRHLKIIPSIESLMDVKPLDIMLTEKIEMTLIPWFLLAVVSYLYYSLRKKYNSIPEAYVDCMVDTYIYGYLRKIIPDHGSLVEGGIKDKIAHYKRKHDLSDEVFPLHKLFIVIPASGYIPPLLEKMDAPGRIELRQNLDPLKLNRAGVDGRVYKSSVYKISFRGDPKQHITVAMEGAPPLVCLLDCCKENPKLRKYKKEMIHMFYTKLKARLSEHEEFENSCELIYFEDDNKSLADYLIYRYVQGDSN